jgi:hypothetical protein
MKKSKAHTRHTQRAFTVVLCFMGIMRLWAQDTERVRVNIVDTLVVRAGATEEAGDPQATLAFTDSALLRLEGDTRFVRALEIEISAPQSWLSHYGTLGIGIYALAVPDKSSEADESETGAPAGICELEVARLFFGALGAKLRNIYEAPVRARHGLKSSPYAVVTAVAPVGARVLVRLTPVMKGIPDAVESMRFRLKARALLSNEGAVSLSIKYPQSVKESPISVFIDDQAVADPRAEQVLDEGEHSLTILSDAYRTENRRFMVTRGKTTELAVTLSDTTPVLLFEAPEGAEVFLDDALVARPASPVLTTAGAHVVRITVAGYSLTKHIEIEKGKTYRLTFTADMAINEE